MSNSTPKPIDFERRRFMRLTGGSALLAGLGNLFGSAYAKSAMHGQHASMHSREHALGSKSGAPWRSKRGGLRQSDSVLADATFLPAPISRDYARHHDIELTTREVEAELDSGAKLMFMPWDDQVPGPMIRVRQDDTVTLTVTNHKNNMRPHNLDLHAVYATGGGAAATWVNPGERTTERFKCMYPGAYIYHCAVDNLDEHISRGMFGMIVVEPHEGLPEVDKEFYLGQHEIYTAQAFGSHGKLDFDYDAMQRERPSYVVFNGAVDGYTSDRFGALQAEVGETVRVFMVNGGPNLLSSFHPIGNVWTRCWPQGAFANQPTRYVQTQPVPPGSCFVGDLDLPVPETINLVDHALSRYARKGLLAQIDVSGNARSDIFEPSP